MWKPFPHQLNAQVPTTGARRCCATSGQGAGHAGSRRTAPCLLSLLPMAWAAWEERRVGRWRLVLEFEHTAQPTLQECARAVRAALG